MREENIYNIPNGLSLYRIIIVPFIIYLLISGDEKTFAIFLCINLITDFLDGFIARTFNQVTNFGARLDSLADYGTYFLAFTGLFVFKWGDLANNGWILYIFILLMVTIQSLHFLKFGTFSSFHLYSFKTTGYLHGLLFILWFFVGFVPVYYYFAIGFGILSEIESLTLVFRLKERKSNAKGLYWVIREKRANNALGVEDQMLCHD